MALAATPRRMRAFIGSAFVVELDVGGTIARRR